MQEWSRNKREAAEGSSLIWLRLKHSPLNFTQRSQKSQDWIFWSTVHLCDFSINVSVRRESLHELLLFIQKEGSGNIWNRPESSSVWTSDQKIIHLSFIMWTKDQTFLFFCTVNVCRQTPVWWKFFSWSAATSSSSEPNDGCSDRSWRHGKHGNDLLMLIYVFVCLFILMLTSLLDSDF